MGDHARRIVIVGGGGHACVLVDALRAASGVEIAGYVAPEQGALSDLGVAWLGGDEVRETLRARGLAAAVLGVGAARSNDVRRKIFADWSAAGFSFDAVIHPNAIVSPYSRHGAGVQIVAGAVLNAGARLGANVIVNTNATVEHHCEVAEYVHIAPGATLCGGVSVGAGTLIGAGAVVVPGVRIGSDVRIGAGSVVMRDVHDGVTVIGAPARATALGIRS